MYASKYELFLGRAAEADDCARTSSSKQDRALWLQWAASYRVLADNEQWLNGVAINALQNRLA